MDRNYFKPWKGKSYSATKVLILSESVYSERDDLSPTHTRDNVRHFGIKHFGESRYYTLMGRALCGTKDPDGAGRAGVVVHANSAASRGGFITRMMPQNLTRLKSFAFKTL
jgi:hypothetical protein